MKEYIGCLKKYAVFAGLGRLRPAASRANLIEIPTENVIECISLARKVV